MSNRPDAKSWAILILLTLIWGFSYYFIKHSLISFSPTQISALRMIISFVMLIPFIPHAFKKISFDKYWPIFVCGFIGSFLPAFLYPFAQTKISSSLAGIINAFTPICTYSIGILFYEVAKEKSKIAGSIIALLGAIILIGFKPNASFKAEGLYVLIAFIVPFLYGFNGNILKSKLAGISGVPLTALMYVMMAGLSIPVAIYSGAFSQIPVAIQSGNAFYHLLALSAFGSAIAMVLFNILIQRVHILFAASVTYLMPCVSLIVGWLDGEQIGWNDIAGFAFILFGVLIINQVIRWKSTETAV